MKSDNEYCTLRWAVLNLPLEGEHIQKNSNRNNGSFVLTLLEDTHIHKSSSGFRYSTIFTKYSENIGRTVVSTLLPSISLHTPATWARLFLACQRETKAT